MRWIKATSQIKIRIIFVGTCILRLTTAVIGEEDDSSIERHVKVLQMQDEKMQPDTTVVKDHTAPTFAWRRQVTADGMSAADEEIHFPVNTQRCQRTVQLFEFRDAQCGFFFPTCF